MKKILAILFLTLASNCNAEHVDSIPKLSVNGEATLYKPADQIIISLGVVTQGLDAESTLKDNSVRIQSVIDALTDLGLKKGEYQTGRFSISPQYTPQPKDPPPNWQSEINGYRVENTLTIKTAQIAITGKLIDAVTKNGANTIDHVTFTLQDPRSYRNEAIDKATANAIQDAQTLAKAANVKLKNIYSIILDPSGPLVNAPMYKTFRASAAPIEPSDVEVHARVTVTYMLDGE